MFCSRQSNPHFCDLIKTLDTVSSNLHREGVGVYKSVIIWTWIVILGEGSSWCSSPKQLQDTVFFYMGLNFILRGIQEQYNLVLSQPWREPTNYYVYDSSVYYEYRVYLME